MAKIVLGLWTSHGPQLSTTPEEWLLRLPADRARTHWRRGERYTFDELVRLRAHEGLGELAAPEARARHHAACQAAIARTAEIWQEIAPDACVIFGNDQRELLLPSMQPAFTIYHGERFWNGPLAEARAARLPPGIRESEWANRPPRRVDYPALSGLAGRLFAAGLDEGWDFAASNDWPRHGPEHHHEGTPHAFAYVIRRVMRDRPVPTLPIITNTFFPPNQPRAWRCFDLGRLVHRVLSEWEPEARVAVVGSGGMSHFVIDEDFDRALLDAIQRRDHAFLRGIGPELMKDGTSELLNWVSAAGCLFETQLRGEMTDYVPCYRSEAGTGTGQGFIAWT